jgi:hypothetical protein
MLNHNFLRLLMQMIEKAGVPCPMRVRGFVIYGAPQNNNVHIITKVIVLLTLTISSNCGNIAAT